MSTTETQNNTPEKVHFKSRFQVDAGFPPDSLSPISEFKGIEGLFPSERISDAMTMTYHQFVNNWEGLGNNSSNLAKIAIESATRNHIQAALSFTEEKTDTQPEPMKVKKYFPKFRFSGEDKEDYKNWRNKQAGEHALEAWETFIYERYQNVDNSEKFIPEFIESVKAKVVNMYSSAINDEGVVHKNQDLQNLVGMLTDDARRGKLNPLNPSENLDGNILMSIELLMRLANITWFTMVPSMAEIQDEFYRLEKSNYTDFNTMVKEKIEATKHDEETTAKKELAKDLWQAISLWYTEEEREKMGIKSLTW
ncbi:hypothetical protein GF389_02600 [Candidatus Dojkabacteria bacterium]|nr:hypothetical protein [Candidatus Dojkabacteria bacterium]